MDTIKPGLERVRWQYDLRVGSSVQLTDFYFEAGKHPELFERGRTYTVGDAEKPQLGAPIVKLRLPSG